MSDGSNDHGKDNKPHIDAGGPAKRRLWDIARDEAASGVVADAKPEVNEVEDEGPATIVLANASMLPKERARTDAIAHELYLNPQFQSMRGSSMHLTGHAKNEELVRLLRDYELDHNSMHASGLIEHVEGRGYSVTQLSYEGVADAGLRHIQRMERHEGVPKENVGARMLTATLDAIIGLGRQVQDIVKGDKPR